MKIEEKIRTMERARKIVSIFLKQNIELNSNKLSIKCLTSLGLNIIYCSSFLIFVKFSISHSPLFGTFFLKDGS